MTRTRKVAQGRAITVMRAVLGSVGAVCRAVQVDEQGNEVPQDWSLITD